MKKTLTDRIAAFLNRHFFKYQKMDVFDKGLVAYKKKGYSTALKAFQEDAEKGNARAQNSLGEMYATGGEGVEKNSQKAAQWFRLAAEQGVVSAQYHLALIYVSGEGVKKDPQEAAKWYRLSAEQGYMYAQYNLGIMYSQGEGVARNIEECIKWYRLAAEQGCVQAQYNLGVMYSEGESIVKNVGEGIKWYCLAAEQGDAPAQSALGYMYENGEGVTKNIVLAYALYNIAAVQGGDLPKKNRDELEPKLTPQQLEEALSISQTWKVNTPFLTTTKY